MNSLLHLVLTLLLTSATFALELNAVNPDAVTVGESPSTNACRSAHLQQPDGSCSPNPTCASQYFLTNVKQLETEVTFFDFFSFFFKSTFLELCSQF